MRNVLLTEAPTPTTYGRAFGRERAIDSPGAVIGLLAVGLMTAVGLRSTLALTLAPGLADQLDELLHAASLPTTSAPSRGCR